jgi:tetratricopeptide (TPR) repeat protein
LILLATAPVAVSAAGEEKPRVVPPAMEAPKPQISDWKPILDDFQGSDPARQQVAIKTLVDAGNSGFQNVTPLLKKNDEALSKRVKEVQRQIEARSGEMYQAVCAKHVQLLSKPLEAAPLEQLAIEWDQLFAYTPNPRLQRDAWQYANDMRRRSKNVEAANQKLTEVDNELVKDPAPAGIARASLLVNRSEMLMALQRYKDALISAQDAITAGGKTGRMTPLALKILAENHARLNDTEHARGACNTILADFPRSLEVHFAHQAILDSYIQDRRWDDAIRQLKAFMAAFPIDEDAQQAANGLLRVLMDDEHDYRHATDLAEWLMANLPLERIPMDVPRCFGGCNEYVFKDYNRAERGYAMLRDSFADSLDVNEIKVVIERVKLKASGKFPKEPDVKDDGPAGALAQFLRAVRTRDAKALSELVLADKIKEMAGRLTSSTDSLVTAVTFSDVTVKHIEMSSNRDSALMFVDVYPSASMEPKSMFEAAMIEDGKWRIRWKDIDEDIPAPDPKAAQEEWKKANSKPGEEKKDEKKEEKKDSEKK